MKKVTLLIELTLEAPFLTKSTDVGAFLIDAPFAQTADKKNFQFPRKLIKGCLRQAIEEIFDAIGQPDQSEIEKWFGDKSQYERDETRQKDETSNAVEPRRGKIFFSDFVTGKKGEKKTLTKIRIDPERGAVKENHLLVIESPFKPRERVKFKGNITYFAKDEDEYRKVRNWISKGLNWITNLGALENINFGQLVKVKFTDVEQEVKEVRYSTQKSSGEESFALIIRPKEPFCISKRRTTENLFESEEFIPGGVLKGCLAETLKFIAPDDREFKLLKANLHCIRFTHAFPSKTRVRLTVAPLSLVKLSQPSFFDVANIKDASLIGISPQSPAFSVDWKAFADVDDAFGWRHPKTVLSVQTAIEDNKAKEGQLFAYEKINPEGFEWLGRVDLRGVDEKIRGEVEKQLRCVCEQNLLGLGKTKAECEIEMLTEDSISDRKASKDHPRENKFIITLQTPFLLCNPQGVNELSGKVELFNSYADTWNEFFAKSATLSYFFASQSLAGGEYLYKRFQDKRLQANNSYNPFLLTDAGSVFIFDVADPSAASSEVAKWLKKGLPLPGWVKDLYLENINEKDYWQYLPFLPENGYGEVAVNLDVHWDNAPEPTEV